MPRELRPELEEAYRTVVRDRASPGRQAYRARLDERIRRARERHGSGGAAPWEGGGAAEPGAPQLALF